MKSNTEILREHIDLVRRVDEGLASAALGAIGGALVGGGLSSWFNRKEPAANKSASSASSANKSSDSSASSSVNKTSGLGSSPSALANKSSSSSDEIDISKMDVSDPKDSGTQQTGPRNGAQDSGVKDRLGYTPEDYVDQSIVPVTANVGLPQGNKSSFYRVARAVDRARERAGMPPSVILNSWDCAGSALILATHNMPWSQAMELDKIGGQKGGWEKFVFDPMGLDVLSEGKAQVQPNQFGGATVDLLVLMKKSSGNAYVYASLEQVIPFRSAKGPGLRSMFIDFFGPKKTWDGAGREQLQALFSSFKLANGAQELKSKGD